MKKKGIMILAVAAVVFSGVRAYCVGDTVKRLQVLNEHLDELKAARADFFYKGSKRDPFIPLAGIAGLEGLTYEERELLPDLPSLTEIKKLYPFTLIGIAYSRKGRSLAIINDKIVKNGDEVNGAKVLDIQSGSVRLLWNKKEIYLSIEDSIVRRTK